MAYGRGDRAQWVRLCRQYMRDLAFWLAYTRGEGRDLVPALVNVTMHSDAVDVG